MKISRLTAALAACVIAVGCVSCEKKDNADSIPQIGESGVSDLVIPSEDSEEHGLGEYRYSEKGTKLYYGDETITNEILLFLEDYFLNLQNKNFEGYKNSIYPDYAERYDKYLREEYSKTLESGEEYSLSDSFEKQRANISDKLIDTLLYESTEDKDFTGEFKITRIRAERPIIEDGTTEEELLNSYFEYLNNVFDTDYQKLVEDDTEAIEPLTIFVMADAEDGEEHMVLSEMNIVLVKKDGKYYTLG